MKWGPFIILALATIVLQTSVLAGFPLWGAFPDLMFVLAVHYAMWAPWPEAGLAAWILGFILGAESAGVGTAALYAFCYGAAAWLIVLLRQVLFREHPATQVLVTLVFALGVQLAAEAFHGWKAGRPALAVGAWPAALGTAVLTAAVAPLVHRGLAVLGGWTGLRVGRGRRR